MRDVIFRLCMPRRDTTLVQFGIWFEVVRSLMSLLLPRTGTNTSFYGRR